jgi:adenosylcobinamide-GDP ribazoletransferase
VKSFLAALQFLTIFPWPRRSDRSAGEIGEGAAYFPLVGLILGAVLAGANALLEPFVPASLLSVALVTALAWLSRGLHLDGLADTFDGVGAGGERERVLRIMDDAHIGVFGLVAVVLLMLFKVRAIELMDAERWRALLIAPLLGRWAMVLLGYRSKAAKEGLGSILIAHMRGKHLIVATVTTLVLVAAFLDITGVSIMIGIAVFTITCKSYFHRRLGGVTGDIFGAVGELSETSVLVFLALAQR